MAYEPLVELDDDFLECGACERRVDERWDVDDFQPRHGEGPAFAQHVFGSDGVVVQFKLLEVWHLAQPRPNVQSGTDVGEVEGSQGRKGRWGCAGVP